MAPAATSATPRGLSGCHAACPRCGLHNAALCAIACFSRHAPFACNGPGFAPHSRRYANLAPATGAPACVGALKIAPDWPSTAAFQSYELRPRHMPSRAPTPGTFLRRPGGAACNGSYCVARFRFGSLAPHPPQEAPQKQVDHRVASANFSTLARFRSR